MKAIMLLRCVGFNGQRRVAKYDNGFIGILTEKLSVDKKRLTDSEHFDSILHHISSPYGSCNCTDKH